MEYRLVLSGAECLLANDYTMGCRARRALLVTEKEELILEEVEVEAPVDDIGVIAGRDCRVVFQGEDREIEIRNNKIVIS